MSLAVSGSSRGSGFICLPMTLSYVSLTVGVGLFGGLISFVSYELLPMVVGSSRGSAFLHFKTPCLDIGRSQFF